MRYDRPIRHTRTSKLGVPANRRMASGPGVVPWIPDRRTNLKGPPSTRVRAGNAGFIPGLGEMGDDELTDDLAGPKRLRRVKGTRPRKGVVLKVQRTGMKRLSGSFIPGLGNEDGMDQMILSGESAEDFLSDLGDAEYYKGYYINQAGTGWTATGLPGSFASAEAARAAIEAKITGAPSTAVQSPQPGIWSGGQPAPVDAGGGRYWWGRRSQSATYRGYKLSKPKFGAWRITEAPDNEVSQAALTYLIDQTFPTADEAVSMIRRTERRIKRGVNLGAGKDPFQYYSYGKAPPQPIEGLGALGSFSWQGAAVGAVIAAGLCFLMKKRRG